MTNKLFFIMFLIVLTTICDTVSQLFLKTSINSLKIAVHKIKDVFLFVFKLFSIPWVWVSFLFSTLSLLIWLFVLSRAELNFAFSIDSMHYIFIAFASRFLLKEKVGFLRWIGTILIVIGITLVSLTGVNHY